MVSIIIPIYNVEQYITVCLQSVGAQTYTDYEVILVDDCGTDNTMNLVEKFINDNINVKDNRWRVIRQEKNMGPSAARNLGVASAKGEYIFFLDSDDTLMPDCLEQLLKTAKLSSADITVGNYKMIGEDKWIPRFNCGDKTYTYDAFYDFLNGNYYLMVWNKLVKRDILERNHISFPIGIHHGEDAAWSFSLACVANKVAYVFDETYNYYVRKNGLHAKDTFRNFFASYLFLIEHYAKDAQKYSKSDDSKFHWWYERQKALHFKQTMTSGTIAHQKEIYSIIRRTLPQGAWTKQNVHYLLPSWLGIMAYKKWCGLWLL